MTNFPQCWFAFALVVLLAGCAGQQHDFQEPEVHLTRIVPVAGSGLEQRFLIGLRILNPNRNAIRVSGLSYTVSLQGQKVVSGVSANIPRISGYGEAEVEVEASTNLLAGVRLLVDLMNRPAEAIDYELEARLDVGRLALPLRIRDSGSIQLGMGRETVRH